MALDMQTKPGTKVVFHNPNAGTSAQIKHARDHDLEVGGVYTVAGMLGGMWDTHVFLKEKGAVPFNADMFED